MPNKRQQLTTEEIERSVYDTIDKLHYRLKQKGMGVFASNHEIYGVIRQETTEYEEAIHKRLSSEEKIEELKDIAVAAIFGIASIQSGGVDW